MQPRDILDSVPPTREFDVRDVPPEAHVDPLELSRMEDEGCPNTMHTEA